MFFHNFFKILNLLNISYAFTKNFILNIQKLSLWDFLAKKMTDFIVYTLNF